MYCQTLEFQFLGTKSSSLSTATPPWQIKKENDSTPAKKPNSIESQIAAVHKAVSQSPPSQISERKVTTPPKKANVFKVADIAKALLAKKVEDTPCEDYEPSNLNEVDDNQQKHTHDPPEPPARRTRRKTNNN